MHKEMIIYTGNKSNADKALILLHGRGSGAEDILSLTDQLLVSSFLQIAPQATNHSWYPNSFLAPIMANEPALSSSITLIHQLVSDTTKNGIARENIYFIGFSQGACLTLEYTSRYATRYGGIIAFTGGLIGDKIHKENYKGNFSGTPVFIGSANNDIHVPVQRVYETGALLKEMGAELTEQIYYNMGHTVNQDELDQVNAIFFNNSKNNIYGKDDTGSTYQ
jgi:phospholipase/carboxylesterase